MAPAGHWEGEAFTAVADRRGTPLASVSTSPGMCSHSLSSTVGVTRKHGSHAGRASYIASKSFKPTPHTALKQTHVHLLQTQPVAATACLNSPRLPEPGHCGRVGDLCYTRLLEWHRAPAPQGGQLRGKQHVGSEWPVDQAQPLSRDQRPQGLPGCSSLSALSLMGNRFGGGVKNKSREYELKL